MLPPAPIFPAESITNLTVPSCVLKNVLLELPKVLKILPVDLISKLPVPKISPSIFKLLD